MRVVPPDIFGDFSQIRMERLPASQAPSAAAQPAAPLPATTTSYSSSHAEAEAMDVSACGNLWRNLKSRRHDFLGALAIGGS